MALIDPRTIGIRRTGADRKLSPERELELVRDWLQGMKIRDLEDKFGVTKPTMYAVLDRHQIQRRKVSGQE